MIVCLAMLLAASPELTVSHRRVTTSDGVALAVYRYERPGPKVSVPVLLVPDVGFTRAAGGATWTGYLRVNNLADVNYAGSVIVGDTGGRYFEPAPGRNWVGGVSVAVAF